MHTGEERAGADNRLTRRKDEKKRKLGAVGIDYNFGEAILPSGGGLLDWQQKRNRPAVSSRACRPGLDESVDFIGEECPGGSLAFYIRCSLLWSLL
jgi:hypothetical protein